MLKHYVIVRRDLPLGVMAAMVLHAASESKWLAGDSEPHDIAVVLGIDSELELFRLQTKIQAETGGGCMGITESGGTYDGQLMAVGVCPIPEPIECLKDLKLLSSLIEPESETVEINNADEFVDALRAATFDNAWGV